MKHCALFLSILDKTLIMFRYTLWLLLLSASLVVNAQTFTNIAFQQGIVAYNSNNLHGSGVSGVDFDQDGWDDLTFCLDGQIKTYRNNQGTAQLVDFGFVVDDNAKHPLWVDYDNDGDLDFYFTQYFNPNKLYRNDGGVFTDVTSQAGLPITNVSTYGASWGDYDNDGDLDLYECNYIYVYTGNSPYEWHNHLYRNNGDGTFSDVTITAGVSDGISLSFQSVWSDVNLDGWLDLYVINDLEHPNRLYMNTGTGIFIEQGSAYSADVGAMDAMTIAAGDYNNDGREDFFITNTSIGPCALLRNDAIGFTNVAPSANVTLSQLTWGAVWFDQDLDMDLDLYVCENNYNNPQQPNPFLRNNGLGFFTNNAASTFPFDVNDSYSVTKFDWNNDGYLDLAVSNFDSQNAALWRCNAGNKNWVKLNLEGVVSNSFGIGARVELWCGGVLQSAQKHCGESYLGQPSLAMHFGLSMFEKIDSVHVYWPSGFMDVLYELPVNEALSITEGMSYVCSIVSSQPEVCNNNPPVLQCGEHSNFLWNGVFETPTIEAVAGGVYNVLVYNALGLSTTCSTNLEVNEIPYFEADVTHVSCANSADGSLHLSFPTELVDVQWTSGATGLEEFDLQAGWQAFVVTDTLGCYFHDSLFVSEPQMLDVSVLTQDVFCHGDETGEVELNIMGGTSPYTINWQDINPSALQAGEYMAVIVDSNGCETQIDFEINEPEPMSFSLESVSCDEVLIYVDAFTSGGQPPYTWWWSNGSNMEDLQAPLGIYFVVVIDDNECSTEPIIVECPSGLYELHTAFNVYPNPTSGMINIAADEPCQVTVFNSIGAIVLTTRMDVQKTIDLSAFPDGMYFLQSTVNQKDISIKVSKRSNRFDE